jgi:hypothetical protein
MKIEKLLAEATARPWEIEPDNRCGMEWNNHIVTQDGGHTVCFMAHSGVADNSEHEASAALIAALANSAEALVALVKAARALGSVPHEYSPHDDKQCPACANTIAFQEALAALPEDWQE